VNILEKIVLHKRKEVTDRKAQTSIANLEQSEFFGRTCVSLSETLKRANPIGIIAEMKRSSPSTGMMRPNLDVPNLGQDYIHSGASALSILTDSEFFAGKNEDLRTARKSNDAPILRKDFIVDEYQLIEAKSIGADCILLIAACLETRDCARLAESARSLGLEVLLEVHSKEEIDAYPNEHINLIGINNRNLKTFQTSIQHSLDLYDSLPQELVKISESGISNGAQLRELKNRGFDGFLIGGHFMKSNDPATACKDLIKEFKKTAL